MSTNTISGIEDLGCRHLNCHGHEGGAWCSDCGKQVGASMYLEPTLSCLPMKATDPIAVWTVNEYADSYRERPEKVRKQTYLDGKTPYYKHIFDTENEARNFILNRAAEGIETARENVKSAERRLKKCMKKFGVKHD